MSFVFNPFTGNFDSTVSAVTDLSDEANYYLCAGTRAMTKCLIDATVDHEIYNSSDNLIVKNFNSNKSIQFNVNSAGTQHDFVKLDGNTMQMLISNSASKVIASGIVRVSGTWSTGVAASAMDFDPTISSGGFYGFYVHPVLNSQNLFLCLPFSPTAGANHKTTQLLQYTPPAHGTGYNDTVSRYTESMTRTFFQFAANDAATVAYNPIDLGGAVTLGDIGFTNVAFTETMIKLSGGSSRAVGTGGTLTQTGIQFAGFGTVAATTTVKALTADGGIFELRADNCKWFFGAASDAEIYFDGTDFVVDSDAVSNVGTLKLNCPANWTANGTNTVTISNVAPAGVGTATITKWLTVKDDSGVVMYIPAWT